MADTITPAEKDQPASKRSRDRGGRLVVKTASVPLAAQLALIVVAFAVALLVVTLLFTHMDQPPSTPPAPADNSG